jgi:Antitoxin ParD
MSRLSIEITDEQHQQIKAFAAMQGKSIKDFILEKLFSVQTGNNDEKKAWQELQNLLTARIAAAESGAVSNKTFAQITEETIQKWNATNESLSN